MRRRETIVDDVNALVEHVHLEHQLAGPRGHGVGGTDGNRGEVENPALTQGRGGLFWHAGAVHTLATGPAGGG